MSLKEIAIQYLNKQNKRLLFHIKTEFQLLPELKCSRLLNKIGLTTFLVKAWLLFKFFAIFHDCAETPVPLYLLYVTAGKSKDPIVLDEHSKTQEPKTVCYQIYVMETSKILVYCYIGKICNSQKSKEWTCFCISDRKTGKLQFSRILSFFVNIT